MKQETALLTFLEILEKQLANDLYTDSLSPEQAESFAQTTSRNSLELLKDAFILHKEKRYQRAISLAILAIEEAQKARQIGLLSRPNEKDDKTLKKAWASLRSHTIKLNGWAWPALMANIESYKEPHILKDGSVNENHPISRLSKKRFAVTLNRLKQYCLYTDFYEDGISNPDQLAEADFLSEFLLKIAERVCNGSFLKKDHRVLFYQLCSPKKHDYGLREFAREMVNRGYWEQETAETLLKIVFDGLTEKDFDLQGEI